MSSVPPGAWRRAAVYGSLWAAVEIVVGSMLHNLRIPLAGSLLASFGVLVMTAAHRFAPERGLIWRAALVCALMKSISPSAVILGPMVGIAMEGFLLEAAVRAARGAAVGYVVGGALAVSWALVQRVLNALISFGPDVVRLYVDAYRYAARVLGVSSFGPFDLVVTLFLLEMLAGGVAASLGLHAARLARTVAAASPGSGAIPLAPLRPAPTLAEGHWSLSRLTVLVLILAAGMVGLSRLPLAAIAVAVGLFAIYVLRTYPRAAARIRRPSLWIELAVVMLASGLVLGGVRNGWTGLLTGLAAGAEMTLRAMLMLFGFTAISVELRNPAILSWVERRRLRGLSDALGMAFGTLPAFTSAAGQFKHLWRHPLTAIASLVRLSEDLLSHPSASSRSRRVAIVTGTTGSGKTTLVEQVVEQLRRASVRVGGILAPGYLHENRRTGFDLVDLATGERATLARERLDVPGPHVRWSRFAFDEGGLALGRRALGETSQSAQVIVVDEVGPMELSGGGWAEALDRLAADSRAVLLLVVRESVLEAVVARWGSEHTGIFEVPGTPPEAVARFCLGEGQAPGSSLTR